MLKLLGKYWNAQNLKWAPPRAYKNNQPMNKTPMQEHEMKSEATNNHKIDRYYEQPSD